MSFRPLVLAVAIALAPVTAGAQGTTISLGELKHDTSLPVEVTADSFSVANDSGEAVFEGNVVVIQGPMRLAAKKITVDYSESSETGSNEIREMTATGGVTFVNGSDAAESAAAVYKPEAGTLRMTGEVLLTQGPTVISGETLTVDLDAGTGVMEGRVRTTFQTGDN